MRIRTGVTVGLLAAMVLVGGSSYSAEKQQAKEQAKEPDPYQNLGLSPDQRGKFDTAVTERKNALTASQQKIVGIRQKLMSLLFDKKASDKEIDKVADQLATADREALQSQIKFHKSIRQILTQEQLTLLAKGGK
jgi:Spy/CpxP family protein refolding chaperone